MIGGDGLSGPPGVPTRCGSCCTVRLWQTVFHGLSERGDSLHELLSKFLELGVTQSKVFSLLEVVVISILKLLSNVKNNAL